MLDGWTIDHRDEGRRENKNVYEFFSTETSITWIIIRLYIRMSIYFFDLYICGRSRL